MFERPREFMKGLIAAARGDEFPEEQQRMPPTSPPIRMLRPDGHEQYASQRHVALQPQDYDDGEYVDEPQDGQQQNAPGGQQSGYQPQLASDEYHQQVYQSYGVEPVRSKKMQDGLSYIAEYIGAISLWLYLGYSQAQVFTGFRFPSWDFNVLFFGGICFVFELIGLVLLFQAAERVYKRDFSGAFVRFTGFALIAVSGFTSQMLLLNSEMVRNILSFPDSALAGLPVNQHFVFFWRSILPASVQVYLVFLVTKTEYDVDKAIDNRRKHQEAIHKLEREDADAMQRKLDNDTLLEMKRVGAEGAKQWAAIMTSGQRNMIQEMAPQLLVQRVHDAHVPEIPEHTQQLEQRPVRAPLPEQIAHHVPMDTPFNRPVKPVTPPDMVKHGYNGSRMQTPSQPLPRAKEEVPVEKRSTVRMNEIEVETVDEDNNPFVG